MHVLTDSGCLDQRAAFKAAGVGAQIVAIEDFLGAGAGNGAPLVHHHHVIGQP